LNSNSLPFVAGGARSYIQETNQTVGNQQQPQSHIQFHFERIALENLFVDNAPYRFLYSTAISVSQYQQDLLCHDLKFSFLREVLMMSSYYLRSISDYGDISSEISNVTNEADQ